MKWFFPLFVVLQLCQQGVVAQIEDHFSDGNLDGWQGDTSHFILNGQEQLQLNAPTGSSESWIYADVTMSDSMVWEIYLKLDFAPSTSNQLRIFLALNSSDVTTATGYYFEIGASGDMDAIDFKFLDAGISHSIQSSAPGLVASDPVELRLRVLKKSNGLWQFFDISETIPVLLFTATHDQVSLSTLSRFGIHTKYTSTRSDKFFFDDIIIKPVEVDLTAPQWLSLSVTNNKTLSLLFDEILDPVVAAMPVHYLLSPGGQAPDNIVVTGNQVMLSWDNPFISQQTYTLTVSGLIDLSGNVIATSSSEFSYTQTDVADLNEILITEIMADPTPAIGLPDAEYIELYNNSSKVFILSDYNIRTGSNEKSLPDSLLLPGEFIILTDVSNMPALSVFGRVVAVENMSALTNSGTTIAITTDDDVIIDEVSYNSTWYHDSNKSDGGWSLELINPLHVCAESENWDAAENLTGGTPGQQNSQWILTPDVTGPQLISVFTGVPGILELKFNEKIEEFLMLDEDLFVIDPSLSISTIELSSPTSLKIYLASNLQEDIIYKLLPLKPIDCLGNEGASTDTFFFGVVALAEKGDVLINEILFNPHSGGSRFIELINASDKFIVLNTLSVGRLTAGQNDIYPITVDEVIGPGEIIVISPEPSDILSRYIVPHPSRMFESSLPSWDDQSDQVSIISGGVVIDSFTYFSSWHHPVISDQNGVSLERISLQAGTGFSSTWHSASSLSGYATPTGPNSQTINISGDSSPFNLTNRHFSPDGDGFKDFLLITFEPESGNAVGSIWVHDLEGREISQILSNETLGTFSQVQWDGRDAAGLIADMGIYLIFVQLWDAQGNVRQYQESIALVKR